MPNLFSIVLPENSKANKFGALILAAGPSSRMDEFKPLLKINGVSLVENAIRIFRDSGVEEIVTVAGYKAETLIPVIESASSRYVINENYSNGMFTSILKGVIELQDFCDGFFLLPVDIPCVRPATIRKLMSTFNADPSLLVCYPEFKTRRGHPPLIDCSLIQQLISYSGKKGMRGFLRRYENRAATVPVADPFIQLDVDTAEDLATLKKQISQFSL